MILNNRLSRYILVASSMLLLNICGAYADSDTNMQRAMDDALALLNQGKIKQVARTTKEFRQWDEVFHTWKRLFVGRAGGKFAEYVEGYLLSIKAGKPLIVIGDSDNWSLEMAKEYVKNAATDTGYFRAWIKDLRKKGNDKLAIQIEKYVLPVIDKAAEQV